MEFESFYTDFRRLFPAKYKSGVVPCEQSDTEYQLGMVSLVTGIVIFYCFFLFVVVLIDSMRHKKLQKQKGCFEY
jgi:hypothetical protein